MAAWLYGTHVLASRDCTPLYKSCRIKTHEKVTDGTEGQPQVGSQDSTECPFVGKPAIAFTAI